MLALIISWILLGTICLCLGTAVLNLLRLDGIKSISDRFFIAQWLGLVITADIFLFISLFTPLIPTVSASVALIIITLSLIPKRNRQELIHFIQQVNVKQGFGIFCLLLFVAIFNPRDVFWYDTGLYHYQVTQWLAKFGAVDGLAQVHSRFGFTSSWFALSAVFDHGLLETRVSSLVNGLVDLLLISHFLIVIKNIISQTTKEFSNYFIVFTYLIITITSWYEGLNSTISPDYSIIILAVFMGWLLLRFTEDITLLLVILSAGAIAIKLSAIPLLAISFLYIITSKQYLVKKLILSTVLGFFLVLPSLLYATKVSGCPLFPSGVLCLDLPWAFSSEEASNVSKIIREWARWGGATPADANWWNWLPDWSVRQLQATIQILLSVITLIVLISSKHQVLDRDSLFILILGGVGITFMMVMAPDWRFGLGYLTVIPALGFALLLSKSYDKTIISIDRLSSTLKYLTKPALWIMLLIIWSVIFRERTINWLVPLPLRQPEILITKEIDGLKYTMPTNGDDRCWSATIPCTPEDLDNRVKLLRPEMGIAGGFATVN